jgi:hypothetical protein
MMIWPRVFAISQSTQKVGTGQHCAGVAELHACHMRVPFNGLAGIAKPDTPLSALPEQIVNIWRHNCNWIEKNGVFFY